MNGTPEIAVLRDARAKRDRLHAAVRQWMADEGTKCRLRYNYQAPMWLEYEAAEKALDEARQAVEK